MNAILCKCFQILLMNFKFQKFFNCMCKDVISKLTNVLRNYWSPNDLLSALKLVVELHVIQTVTLSFYGFKLIYPVFKIIDYPKNKLFTNIFCMRQIISPSCATDNQNLLELHVLWRFCICMFECLEWGNTIVVHI